MMSFRDFLTEDEHKDGTYVNVKPTKEAKDELYNWIVDNGITPAMSKDDYHVTVIYSTTPCPDAKNYDFNLPLTGNIVGWKVFDSQLGRCLVAAVQSEGLQKINGDLRRDYGATSNFPEYIPHITVSWGFEGEIPQNYPAMEITFDKVEVKGLDPNWKPK